jgi:hypothetical protein
MADTKIVDPIELTDAELDAVAAGANQRAEDSVVVAQVAVEDVNVNVNALTGPVFNINR